MRQSVVLSPEEGRVFETMRQHVHHDGRRSRLFWQGVASARGLDPASLMELHGQMTGLPLGHGKHWCWPLPLECRKAA